MKILGKIYDNANFQKKFKKFLRKSYEKLYARVRRTVGGR